jgi:hypothetical protein
MPVAAIKSFAKKTGKSESELESKWKEAKELAKKEGHSEDYDYIMAIFKKLCGIKESVLVNRNEQLLLY